MIFRRFLKSNQKNTIYYLSNERKFCSIRNKSGLENIRNVGILAHIDAGKTTTTERLLYFSGKIKRMGEVHKGNTVTDYLEQERNRGITITSAFVSFNWDNHVINLVDTPGHIDFTGEIVQGLNVIDSAVLVLDASEGVEVQTISVWKQADQKNLPCLAYANKMDRQNSHILTCVNSLENKLGVKTLLLHLPVKENSTLSGLIDLVSMKKFVWSDKGVQITPLSKGDENYVIASEKRNILIDRLSSLDNDLADIIIDAGSFDTVTEEELHRSIRKVTILKLGVPVVCGSSYRNIGIENLLNSMVRYLPSPIKFSDLEMNKLLGNEVVGKSFKIMHDKQRGALVFFRIYNGRLEKGQKVYNFSRDKADRASFLYNAFADELKEVPSVTQGNFVAVSGLNSVQSGDVICASENSSGKLKKLPIKEGGELDKLLQCSPAPNPVFFCSVEPFSQAHQLALDKALSELSREDPSLKIAYEDETGETTLGGMGELHLEIVKDRLKSEYKLDVEFGPLQIIYKEKPRESIRLYNHRLHSSVGSNVYDISIHMSLIKGSMPQIFLLDNSREAAQNLVHVTTKKLALIKEGIKSALAKGPLLSCEVVGAHAILHHLEISKRAPDSLLVAASFQCMTKMLKESGTVLLEPVMEVIINVEDIYLDLVLGDLSRRRASIHSILTKESAKEILSDVPLSEVCGYAKYLRTITSGSARLSIEFNTYQEVLPDVQERIMNNII